MSSRKFLIIGVTIAYAILIGLSLHLRSDEEKNENIFDLFNPQIRFCCRNMTSCSEKSIRENFNSNNFANHQKSLELSDFSDFELMFGSPKCTLEEQKFEEASIVSLDIEKLIVFE